MSSPDSTPETRIAEIERRASIGKRPSFEETAWLIDQLRASRKDTERLDWMQQKSATCSVFDPPSGDASVWEVSPTGDDNEPIEPGGAGDTLRGALDNAMLGHAADDQKGEGA